MSLVPKTRMDKHCFIQCPPESCDCIAGAPPLPLPTLFGVKVIVDPHMLPQPRMRLKHDVPVTPEFRQSYDLWLKSFFGTEERVLEMRHPLTHELHYVMSTRSAEALKLQSIAQSGNLFDKPIK